MERYEIYMNDGNLWVKTDTVETLMRAMLKANDQLGYLLGNERPGQVKIVRVASATVVTVAVLKAFPGN